MGEHNIEQPTPRLVVWKPEDGDVPDLSGIGCSNVSIATNETIATAVTDANVVLVADFGARDADAVWRNARSLQWVHALSTGIDHILTPSLVESDTVLTNGRGCFDRSIAEFVLMMVLSLAKDLPACIRAQSRRRWHSHESDCIEGAAALVIGPGAIGSRVAMILTAVGMSVDGVGRRARPDSGAFRTIYSVSDLSATIGRYDYVIITVPLTRETTGLINADILQAIKPTARIINVARGEIIDEQALTEALSNQSIGGAALDVFTAEPLQSTSPLWTLPNVVITGHMAGDFAGWRDREYALFAENFQRFLTGKPLLNVINKPLGYVTSAEAQ